MTTLASVSTSPAAATYSGAPIHRLHHARRDDGDGDDTGAPKAERSSDGPGRRNPLVAAMMSALQSLMSAPAAAPAAAAAAPATTAVATTAATPATTTPGTGTATAANASSDPSSTLREAAYAFAHELYNALRGNAGGGNPGDNGGGERHHHHHRHHGGGYGDLAQRLTSLASKLDGGTAAATPGAATTPAPATPAPAPVVDTPAPAAPPAAAEASPATPAADAPAAGTTNINITININLGGTPAAGPATPAAAPSSPLVDAFKNLLTALGSAGHSDASPTERLTAFLRKMAESLQSSASTDAPAPATPASGGLLNVSA